MDTARTRGISFDDSIREWAEAFAQSPEAEILRVGRTAREQLAVCPPDDASFWQATREAADLALVLRRMAVVPGAVR